MNISMNLLHLFIGFVIGLILNGIWWYWWAFLGMRRGKKPLGKYKWPALSILEHYHWATILAILGFRLKIPFLVGVSIAWFADEGLAQQHKFALGSDHFRESTLVEILILAVWLAIEFIRVLLVTIY